MRSDLRLCGAADQLHGPARLRLVHAAPERSVGQARAADRLFVRLYPARDQPISAPGLEEAVAALPELRARPAQPAVRAGQRSGAEIRAAARGCQGSLERSRIPITPDFAYRCSPTPPTVRGSPRATPEPAGHWSSNQNRRAAPDS